MHRLKTGLMVLILCGCAGPELRAEEICQDATKIYFGEKDGEAPATVRAAECFEVISEWKEIERRELDSDDADYWILVGAANRKFRRAVEAAAVAGSYDLVAEEGSLKLPEGAPRPPDLTKTVIDALEKAEKE